MLIGMPEASKRLGMTSDGLRRALLKAGVKLVRINERALAVEESDLEAFIVSRAGYSGMGRPRKQSADSEAETEPVA